MLGRTDSRGRLLLLFLVLTILSGGMVMRLAYWQVNQRERLTTMAGGTSTMQETLPAKRGTIYDRTGTIVLAETIYRYRLVIDLHGMAQDQRQRDTTALVDYLGLTGDPEAALRKAMTGDGYYVILAKDIDPDVAGEIAQGQAVGALPTVTLEPTPVRVYPQAGGAPRTSLAAHVLGFVNAAGRGQYGLEQQYDALLAGRPEVVEVDPSKPGPAGTTVVDPGMPGEGHPDNDRRRPPAPGGAGGLLHLDRRQSQDRGGDRDGSQVGAILAEASYPSYDANLYRQVAAQNPALFMDPVISQVYEPGSVFKMLTASAALQTKTTSLTTKINDSGILKLPGGQEVADADRKAMGWMTFADIVAWSRNVGVSQVAFRLGKTTAAASAALYQTWQSYGIGQKTGIDLAGEVSGGIGPRSRVRALEPDRPGQRLLRAGRGDHADPADARLLRDGKWRHSAHTTRRRVQAVGAVSSPTSASRQVISSSLSDSLTGLMTHVVTAVPSYAQSTYIPGYFVGGKTGTAQIWDPTLNNGKGDWMSDIYDYSFYGWVGHSSPDVAIGAVIYQGKPTKVSQGVLAMPVQSTELFRRIATDAVTGLQIAPNKNGPAAPGGQKAKSLG